MNKKTFTSVKYFQRKSFIKDRNFKGFTLIELLIVIGIIVILAAAVIIAINPGQQFSQARDATRESHLNSIKNSILSYQVDNMGKLPEEITDKTKEICKADVDTCPDELVDLSEIHPDYISSLPIDPQGGDHEDGTGYYIKRGSVNLLAAKAETREVTMGSCPPAVDPDGQVYDTVEIGDQCWFAEDLRYDNGCTRNTWDDSNPHDACDDADDGNLLYQWEAAMDGSTDEGAQGLCPSGWHVPTDEEWKILEMELGMSQSDADDTEFRGTDEGDQMKDPDEDWCDGDPCGGTGFLGLSGGYRDTSGDLIGVDSYGYWWSSTEDDSDAWRRYLFNLNSEVHRYGSSQAGGHSVRCLKDEN